jgi:hypothetical protein
MLEVVPPIEPLEGSQWFIDLFWQADRCRRFDMGQPLTLSPTELVHWMATTGQRLTLDELGVLSRMDEAYLAGLADFRRWESNVKKPKGQK